uniref:ATP synthase F0 subunit 8 n=1 Tax=Engaeus sericatus TaxID=99759 RepID=A0A068WAY6_9EUCA|nr:ATP synthase F0 subunit 8 [Engaeus sericatus]CDR98463.1 ATP synthase F0 subunit 8 [Engaeus sericatus]
MPQMSPLFWLNLFMFFILGFLMFSIINYFMYPSKMKETPTLTAKLMQKIWKW